MELSIITVNKNNQLGLEKTIESVVNQKFNDFEYIIIDGASSDDSAEIIKRYGGKISYWITEEDTGIYNAMNKGIQVAKGRYCFFLNSGDYLFDENVLNSAINDLNDKDIVYGNVIVFDSKQKHSITYPKEITFRDFYTKSIPHSGGSFIKRELFNKFGLYNESYKIVSDWEFFIKTIILGNVSTLHLELFLSNFDLEGVSTQNLQLMYEERRKVMENLIPEKILHDYDKYLKNNEISDLSFSKLCFLLFKRVTTFK